jgi:hypothetical protein
MIIIKKTAMTLDKLENSLIDDITLSAPPPLRFGI